MLFLAHMVSMEQEAHESWLSMTNFLPIVVKAGYSGVRTSRYETYHQVNGLGC